MVTSLSDRPSRVIRDNAEWQPLRMSALAGTRARHDGGRGTERTRGSDVEARIAAAFKDGLAEGRYQANAEAEEREKQAGLTAQQRWSGLLEGLAAGIAEIESTTADRLLDLSAMLAARIACREISIARNRIEPVLAEALRLVTGACRQLEVSAHPSDCAAIETWLKPQCEDRALTIRADASLTPGGCLLRADDTILDATLQTRVARTLAAVGIGTGQARAIADSAAEDLFAPTRPGREPDVEAAP
jgi:flagellar assembly protein FliH